MKTVKIVLLVVGVMALAVLLAACGSASATATFPTGKFVNAGNSSRALQFNADGTFIALDGTFDLARGTYSVKDGVYTEESNNAGCTSPMHYKYTFDGANLKFYPVEDPAKDTCEGRKADFSEAQTWVLKK
jgi:major membrane immunogen (membrane-anchored lipoprotein)